jgi:hypothetical protein
VSCRITQRSPTATATAATATATASTDAVVRGGVAPNAREFQKKTKKQCPRNVGTCGSRRTASCQ